VRSVFVPDAPVYAVAAALVVAVLVAWVFGAVARRVWRSRARLGVAISIVISILGMAFGLVLAEWIDPTVHLWSLLTLGLGLGMSVVGIGIYGAVAAHVQHPQRASVAELVRAGESDRVEFKSTARVNLRTGVKDDRMEQVVAKTVCAFLNADGGTLLVGVDDGGTPLGLTADFATLKAPDVDRFELWLRDLLTTTMGMNAASMVQVDFARLPDAEGNDQDVCRIVALPSPRPVYLRPNKGGGVEFWMRSGNSSRQLTVEDAADYVMHRWPLNLGSALAAQLSAAIRFSEQR
jgi:schlafen family protein